MVKIPGSVVVYQLVLVHVLSVQKSRRAADQNKHKLYQESKKLTRGLLQQEVKFLKKISGTRQTC